jgi:hypothetical protein
LTKFAAVILAHADPLQVRRLVNALDGVPIVLHCDARTPHDDFAEMVTGLPERVTVCRRIPTALASWSLVEAELVALRELRDRADAEHVGVLSGADYPLVSTQELEDELASWRGHTYMRNVPMPYPEWSTPRHRDGGMWRLRHRFLTRRGQIIFVRGVPLRWPIPRSVPTSVTCRAASQWKIYSRKHVDLLLNVVDARPDLVRFWRTTLVPDETFVASVLGSPEVVGDDAMPQSEVGPWFLDWSSDGPDPVYHPQWLTSAHFDVLKAAAAAPSVGPAEAQAASATGAARHRKLFARKFSSAASSSLLDRIDCELRN